jgi:hypothetical protein
MQDEGKASSEQKRAKSRSTRPSPEIKPLTPAFRWTFLAVVVLTVLSLLASIVIALLPEPSEAALRLMETCLTTWKMGFGAILGLIGGKAIK